MFFSNQPSSSSNPAQPLRQLGEKHPNELLCPISLELMRDPVSVSSGHTYERVNIEAWFAVGRSTDPLTGLALVNCNITTNHALRNAIETYRNTLDQAAVVQPVPISTDEHIHQLIYQDSQEFVTALEEYLITSRIQSELKLDDRAAKSYVATVVGLIRKRNLGLLLLPNTEESCCLPQHLIPFITAFIMDHGALMLIRQHSEFSKTMIEVPLNRGEGLLDNNYTEVAVSSGRAPSLLR